MDCCLLHLGNHHPCDTYAPQPSQFHALRKAGECRDTYQAANDTGFAMFANNVGTDLGIDLGIDEGEFFPFSLLYPPAPRDPARDFLQLGEDNFFTGLLATVTTNHPRLEAERPVCPVYPKTEPCHAQGVDSTSFPPRAASAPDTRDSSSHAKQPRETVKRRVTHSVHKKVPGRCLHLWEFVRDLLLNPAESCGVLRWEDRREGVFCVVHSHAFAELWGKRKKNKGMNYEKLSRALRHYYKSGILEPVGKRLMYKFGANAFGWQDSRFQSAHSSLSLQGVHGRQTSP